jgi:uncharacterized membrane protein YgdD (TMEM256/DUF423 family)
MFHKWSTTIPRSAGWHAHIRGLVTSIHETSGLAEMGNGEREGKMGRLFFIVAGASGGLSVLLGAFGAHVLKARLEPSLLMVFETGVRYQMYHTLALLAVGIALNRRMNGRLLAQAGWWFMAGIVLFSGSLYLLTFTGLRWLGIITPIGGLAFMGGWLWLALAAWKNKA